MIGERFRKLQLDQDDIDALKQGFACAISTFMLKQATPDHNPLGTLIVYSDPPSFNVTFDIDGTSYEERTLTHRMGMYTQIHFDNVSIAWQSFLQSFERELKPVLEERLDVTVVSNPNVAATATSPLVVGKYHIQLKPLRP